MSNKMAKALTIMSSCAVSIEAFGNDDCGGATIVAITIATKTKDLNRNKKRTVTGGKKKGVAVSRSVVHPER